MKLINLLPKNLLLEKCLWEPQVEELFNDNPKIKNIILNDKNTKKHGFISYDYNFLLKNNGEGLNSSVSEAVGLLFDKGPEDFNRETLKAVFKDALEGNQLTKENYLKIIELLDNYEFPKINRSNMLKWAIKSYNDLMNTNPKYAKIWASNQIMFGLKKKFNINLQDIIGKK